MRYELRRRGSEHEVDLHTIPRLAGFALQGRISLSTLGIDVKKLDNAENQ